MPPSIPSSASAVLLEVPMLSSHNWHDFVKAAKMYFLAIGLEGIVSGTAPTTADALSAWNALDKLALPLLWARVDREYRYLVEDCDSASAAWKKLKGHFQIATMFTRMRAREDFYSVEHDPSLPIDAYIHAVTEKKTALEALAVKIEDTELKDVLLMRLDHSYHPIRTTIVTQAVEPDLPTVKTLLRASGAASDPVTVKREPGLSHGFSARHRGAPAPSSAPSSAPSRTDAQGFSWCNSSGDGCHRCGRNGHVAARCMRDMPQHVKDWIMANPYNPTQPQSPQTANVAYVGHISRHYDGPAGDPIQEPEFVVGPDGSIGFKTDPRDTRLFT